MKTLRDDNEALLPVILAGALAGLASFLGISWLTAVDPWEFIKVFIVACLLFVFGIIALMGKFIALPKPIGMIVGLGCIGGAIYLVYLGRFPV
jgi:zinc transporter ZupT